MDQQYIYVVFSSTPNKMGRLIRRVTKEAFNHVSISLDKEFKQMYSFSRRFYRLPLYGGFVWESPSRYHVNGNCAEICVCALPVTSRQYMTLSGMFRDMHRRSDSYIYNHLSALGAVIHKPIRTRDAYTCVEFCVNILRELGVAIEQDKYYSVGDLMSLLEPFVVYRGAMPEAESFDERFYAKKPVPHPVYTTLRDMLKLLPRLRS